MNGQNAITEAQTASKIWISYLKEIAKDNGTFKKKLAGKSKFNTKGLYFTYLSARYGQSVGRLLTNVDAMTVKVGNVVILQKSNPKPYVFSVDFSNPDLSVEAQIRAKVKAEKSKVQINGEIVEKDTLLFNIKDGKVDIASHNSDSIQFKTWLETKYSENPIMLAFFDELRSEFGLTESQRLAKVKQKLSDIAFDGASIRYAERERIKAEKLRIAELLESAKTPLVTNVTSVSNPTMPPISETEKQALEEKRKETELAKNVVNSEITNVGKQADNIIKSAKGGKKGGKKEPEFVPFDGTVSNM